MAELREIEDLLNDPGSLKVITSVGRDGVPHSAPKGTLRVNGGNIEYVEVLESSRSFRNVTASLWFGKKVSALVVGTNGDAYEITGSVKKIIVSGRKFEEAYRRLADARGLDIAAVVVVAPESVERLNLRENIAKQEKEHFFFKHLDRIAK